MIANLTPYTHDVLGFRVEPLGRADDAIRMELARWLRDRGVTADELSVAACLPRNYGWRFLSGRSRLRSDNLAALLGAAGGFVALPTTAARLTRPRPIESK